MTFGDPVLGSALGAGAAALHLVTTRSRARVAARGGVTWALATLPISLLLPALVLLAALTLSESPAWAVLLGFWLLRSCALARVLGR